jgi:hypothetical protein
MAKIVSDTRPIDKREEALAEIKNVLQKFNVDIACVPQFAHMEGTGAYVIQTIMQIIEPQKPEKVKANG